MGAASSARRVLAPALVGLVLLAGVAAAGAAGEPEGGGAEDQSRRLEQVRSEIGRLEALLSQARQAEQGLLGDLHRLDLELDLHRRQVQLIEGELASLKREIRELNDKAAGYSVRLQGSRARLTSRLRALYLAGPPAFERVVLTAGDAGELIQAYQAAERAAGLDAIRVREYRQDLAGLRGVLAEREERRTALAGLRTREVARRREIETLRAERSRLLGGVQEEAKEDQAALAEMVSTAADLQRLVEALGKGEAVPPEWRVGFERFRGTLPWPVPGRILVPFGAQRNARFDTRVPHPGVDLAVVAGEPVRAVFDGRVAFSDWFKGYGNLMVLEHGEGFMSVYAHAAERLVVVGDRVKGGEIIARAGDTGSLDGPKLYFEIRRDGNAQDPRLWLTRR